MTSEIPEKCKGCPHFGSEIETLAPLTVIFGCRLKECEKNVQKNKL